MPTYKVVELYPEAMVRLVYRVEAENEEEIRENFQADWGELINTQIDFGGYAYTEEITQEET
jgi:hypothetical protein